MGCFVTVGKHVPAETISSLSLGNRHDSNRRIVESGVFSYDRPEVIRTTRTPAELQSVVSDSVE
jgi:hypothetical protein